MILKCFKEGMNIANAQQMLVFLLPFVTCKPQAASSRVGAVPLMSLGHPVGQLGQYLN